MGKLTQLVTDYNYAQKTGLGDTKEIDKQIQDILTQYPELNSAVVKTASGYELQVSNVKSLVQALTKTLEIEKSRLQTQLAEINNQKQMASLYDTTKAKIDAIDKHLNAAYIKVGDIEKKGEKNRGIDTVRPHACKNNWRSIKYRIHSTDTFYPWLS